LPNLATQLRLQNPNLTVKNLLESQLNFPGQVAFKFRAFDISGHSPENHLIASPSQMQKFTIIVEITAKNPWLITVSLSISIADSDLQTYSTFETTITEDSQSPYFPSEFAFLKHTL